MAQIYFRAFLHQFFIIFFNRKGTELNSRHWSARKKATTASPPLFLGEVPLGGGVKSNNKIKSSRVFKI